MAGFSLGGYTAAALAGARLDPRLLWAVLTGAVPLPDIPEFPGVLEALRAKHPLDEESRAGTQAAGADLSDPRVRAAFLVAPGLGALVTPESLAAVRVPVGLRWGGADTVNPYEVDTRPYREHIPTASGHSAARTCATTTSSPWSPPTRTPASGSAPRPPASSGSTWADGRIRPGPDPGSGQARLRPRPHRRARCRHAPAAAQP
ncbi:hypothetical protein AB6O49_07295 [Streptomyces sp. SBR177]